MIVKPRGMTVEEAGRHIIAASVRKPAADELSTVETIFFLSRSPLTEDKVDALLSGHEDAYLMHAPYREGQQPWSSLFGGTMTLEEYGESFDTLAGPVNDNHPFYFAWDKPMGIPGFVIDLLILPVVAVVLLSGLILLGGRKLGFTPPGLRSTAYFSGLGMGFIIVEVALMQRLILLLGHPIYTLVVILFTLLLAGGLGSLTARKFALSKIRFTLGRILLLVILLVAGGAILLPMVVAAALPLSLAARIGVAGALVFPYGFLMGMPFPLGLRHAAQDPDGSPVSALWGINGVASVVGSIGGLILAVAAGFTWVFVAGAACYVLAFTARPGK